ncbi:MAG: lanthionine synthetase C family protein [Pseudonocardiaceae bacterium]
MTTKGGTWLGSIRATTAVAAWRVSQRVAERMIDPARVQETVCAPGNVGLLEGAHPWDPLSLSHGLPATVLMFGEFDRLRPDDGWDKVGRDHVQALLAAIERAGLSAPGSLAGVAGIGLALWSVSRGGTRYQRVIGKLNAAVGHLGGGLLDEAAALRCGTAPGAYDVVQGIAGLVRYLMLWPGDPALDCLRQRGLEYLTGLARPVTIGSRQVPGWYVSSARQMTSQDRAAFPHGNLNCGLAHGIAGPLAALAIAHLHGLQVEGHQAALRALSGWLCDQRGEDAFGPLWPTRIALENLTAAARRSSVETRASWCYGTPGIARALYLAGNALADRALCELATAGLKGIFERGPRSWGLESPTVCHGLAGLLQVTLRMAHDTHDSDLANHGNVLAEQLAAAFDPSLPFGYRDVERTRDRARWLDKAGLLDGASGVALTLSSAGAHHAPIWDYALLLS